MILTAPAAAACEIQTQARNWMLLLLAAVLMGAMTASSQQDPQAALLLKFRESLQNATQLETWGKSEIVCKGRVSGWKGVICLNDRVSVLRLENMWLYGSIDVETLSRLPGLRSLSVMNNGFSGSVPDVKKLAGLRSLYLSFNRFSGDLV